MISDLNGSLGSRQFLNVANERTCFASCVSEARNFNIYALRGKNRRLLAALM